MTAKGWQAELAQQKKWASDSDKLVKATKKLGSVKKIQARERTYFNYY